MTAPATPPRLPSAASPGGTHPEGGKRRGVQSRRMSLVETVTSTAIGYVVSVAATAVVLPAFGYGVTAPDALGISAVFTVVSLVRGYLVRRAFEGWRG